MSEKNTVEGGTEIIVYYEDQFNIHLKYSGKVTQDSLKNKEKLFADFHPESPVQRIFVTNVEGKVK
jgi:hypothetical protein